MRSWIALSAALLLLPVPRPGAASTAPSRRPAAPSLDAGALARAAERAGLRRGVLMRALAARARVLAGGLAARPVLTVIDYSLPSRERRLWVLDLTHARVLARELVAHGRGSGDDLARHFSNRPGSLQSSLGTFLTGTTYYGKHGLSLHLRGLDPGVNDRAAERAIVIHGASYVDPALVSRLGRLGRSQGCPALNPAAAPRIIELIRGGSVLYAYYP